MDRCALSHAENAFQWSINGCWLYIMGNLGGNRLHIVINIVLDVFRAISVNETLPTPS
jgi:hypothetical protein